MSEIITITYNAVNAQLVDASREVKLIVQAILNYKVQGAEHMQAFKSGGWNGQSSFLEFTKGRFPRGFVALVTARLKQVGYDVRHVKKPFPQPLGPEYPIVDEFPEEERYDYQRQVVTKLLTHGQIIAQIATGGGKSRIAKLCASKISRPTLFLTTRGVLMYQMAEGFATLGKDVAILGDGNIRISKEITCGMVQTISAWLEVTTVPLELDRIANSIITREKNEIAKLTTRLKKAKTPIGVIAKQVAQLTKELEAKRPSDKEVRNKAEAVFERQTVRNRQMREALKQFEFVILEEAHEVSGNSFYEIMRHCENAYYRLALTATPFMKDDEESNMRLMASAGHVAIKVSEETLINRGILAKPYFKYIKIADKPPKLFQSTPWQRAYELGIVEFELRNKHIVAEVLRAKKYGLSSLVLIQHTKHGEVLNEIMLKNGVRSDYIFGDDDQKARKECLRKLKDGELDVVIGSTILDVGVDAPAVGLIVLGGGGKAEVAVRQRIGRGLRAKKKGPNVAFIVDFADDFNNHLKAHYLARRHIVESTKGFGENIVRDFGYVELGFNKVAA